MSIKGFPYHLQPPYLERAARLWCSPGTERLEMQSEIAKIIAALVFALDKSNDELLSANSNKGTRREVQLIVHSALELVK